MSTAHRLGVVLSLLVPPSHMILSSTNSMLQPHRDASPSCRAPECTSSPVLRICSLSPPVTFHLLFQSNYLLFTRSQLKCYLLQKTPRASKSTSCVLPGVDITPGTPTLLAPYHYHIYLLTSQCTLCPHPLP